MPASAAASRGRRPKSGVAPETDWRLLTMWAVMYGSLYLATQHFFSEVPAPLPADADPALFAEGRAMQHLHVLAEEIGHRQVGSVGEERAAQYLWGEVSKLAAAAREARPDLSVEAARESVSGGITMHAFKFEIANVYNNLTNVVLRVAPVDPPAAAARAVLVNAHYDSTLGTKGASDAASCVCVALEVARQLVANSRIRLAAPVVFLFNGGEETLSQAANGFFASSRFAAGLGAFINLESTGPWGPDVVFQHTGDWTLAAYARAAPRPRGTTMAQDFFDLGLIPADTDYRMFSYRHYGALPGVDVAFIFDGTAYHTARDEVARIRPGTLQAMGENVAAAAQEFARVLAAGAPTPAPGDDGGSVYFDLWGRAMVIYSHAQARALHHVPLALVLALPLLSAATAGASGAPPVGWASLAAGAGLAAASTLCALAAPAALGAGRAWLSGVAMAWYGRPRLAYAIYLPAAAAGLVLPYLLAPARRGAAHGRAAGTALLFAAVCSALTSIGMHSSFFYALWAASAAAAPALLPAGGGGAAGWGWRRGAALLALFLPPAAVVLPSAVTFMAHVMEKVGLAGGAPGALGLVVADAAVGAVAGATALLTLGTLAPYLLGALGRRRARRLAAALAAASLAAAAGASLAYRQQYSQDHPKRLLLQHIHRQGPDGAVAGSLISVVGLDGVPLAPALPAAFAAAPPAPFANADWEALYPLNYLISQGAARAAPGPPPGTPTPTLRLLERGPAPGADADAQPSQALQRLQLELDTGRGGAWGVMNFTLDGGAAALARWSLSSKVARTELPEGGVSHMVRFAGNHAAQRYSFWLDAPASARLRVQLYVKFVEESAELAAVTAALPPWASPAAVVSFHSVWHF